MSKKPTYEELELQVRELENSDFIRKRAEETLRKNEREYRSTVDGLPVGVVVHNTDTRILISNQEASNILGLTTEQLSGKEAIDPGWMFINIDSSPMKVKDFPVSKVISTKNSLTNYVLGIIRPDRESVTWVNVNARPLFFADGKLEKVIINFMDITDQKLADEAIKKSEDDLQEKTRRLEEVNIALRVLLKQRNEDRAELGENMLLNIKEMITPYIEKLNASGLSRRQKTFTEIIESNLANIISPFIGKLSSKYYSLTPMEIKVATLVKDGKTNKDMANLLNLSTSTILTHRHHIRNKLGLKNKKINLRSHLLSLQ